MSSSPFSGKAADERIANAERSEVNRTHDDASGGATAAVGLATELERAWREFAWLTRAYKSGIVSGTTLQCRATEIGMLGRSLGVWPESLLVALKKECGVFLASRNEWEEAEEVKDALVKKLLEGYFGPHA